MSKDRLSHPLCQKLKKEADEITHVIIEKRDPYFIRGSGHLYFWKSKYCFGVTDFSSGEEGSATVDYFVSISFTDEDIDRIEQKDKLWIYLK